LALRTLCRKPFVISARGRSLILGKKTAVMGILNVTPDSFSGDGRLSRKQPSPAATVNLALKFIEQGADILDIGGESTRPGAKPVSVAQEIRRVVPLIGLIRRRSDVLISVDTYKEEVAHQALEAGAEIINNVRGTRLTKAFLKMIKDAQAAIILMHSRGTPATMQHQTRYKDLMAEIADELQSSAEKCLSAGIKSDRIILDPGIGFAKTAEQNLQVLKRLDEFRKLNLPILVGTSRKSFIGKVLNADVSDRLMGTAATVALSIIGGAHIVRVHDIKAMRQTADMVDAVLTSS
jgi:dihydropteroate synthase